MDCSTCRRPQPGSCFGCPIDDQPYLTPKVQYLIDLWRRMQRYPGCLPDLGGLLDQEERLMRQLDWVNDRITSRETNKTTVQDQKNSQLYGANGQPIGNRR